MGNSSVRERIAIVFMTLSVVATLVLGGALAAQLGHPKDQIVQVGAASATSPDGGVSAGDQSAAASSDTGAVGDKGPDSPDEGVTGDFITVGGIFDETGPVDATVERDVVRSYFNQVNAAGGVKGRKLRLLDCDSAFDPSRAHQCSQRLLSQKIMGMVGWTSPSGEEPETKFLTGQGVPVIGGLSVPSQFNSPLAYPTMASLELHGTAMGHHAKDLGVQAPGVIIVNVNFIAPLQNAMLKALQEEGIKPVDIEQVDITKADYSDIIVKLRAAGAKSILAGLDPFSYARMFQAMERQNFKVPVLGFGLDKKSANDAYGPSLDGSESLIPS